MNFWELYNYLPDDPDEFVTPFWKEKLDKIGSEFKPEPKVNFLQNGTITNTMFMSMCDRVRQEYAYLKKSLTKSRLELLLTECLIGCPTTNDFDGIMTSSNTVHLLYHIIKYQNETDNNIPERILEWGGGYGNACRLFHKMSSKLTYTIIDVKFFTCVQRMYLTQIYGKDKINVGSYKEGKINLIPLGLLSELDIEAEMFISTWAISESSDIAQKYLLQKEVYKAKQFLMAHQGASGPFPFADNLKQLINKEILFEEEIDLLPGNFYLFA